jgi:radical SAM superfamily enzyme YgiQ (UPF0313 family)
VYDAMTLNHDFVRIENELKKREFDILATSSITPTYPDAAELCRLAKRVNPGCITVIGGVHPTFCFEEILADKRNGIDYIFAGEGELSLYNFLLNFNNNAKRNKTPNIIYKEGNEIIVNPTLPLNDDLDLESPELGGLHLLRNSRIHSWCGVDISRLQPRLYLLLTTKILEKDLARSKPGKGNRRNKTYQ